MGIRGRCHEEMTESVIIPLCVTGTLTNGSITAEMPSQNAEIESGKWFFLIDSLVLKCSEALPEKQNICIASNLLQLVMCKQGKEIVSPGVFQLATLKTDRNQSLRLSRTWYLVTRPNQTVIIYLKDAHTFDPFIDPNTIVTCVVHFKKIK